MFLTAKTQQREVWFLIGIRICVCHVRRLSFLVVVLIAFGGSTRVAQSAETNQGKIVDQSKEPRIHPNEMPYASGTPHPSQTPHLTPTLTPHPSETPHTTPTPTPHPSETPHITPTPIPHPSETPHKTPTPHPSVTAHPTETPHLTPTPHPSETPHVTPTPTHPAVAAIGEDCGGLHSMSIPL